MEESASVSNSLFFAEVDALIKQGKSVRLRIKGTSMLPMLRDGDEVLLVPPTSDNVKRWMPVLADTVEKGIVLHRIVEIDAEEIVLSGDGNLGPFEHTTSGKIIAVATFFYRGPKTIPTDTPAMRLWARFWHFALPCRRIVIKTAVAIKRFWR